MAPTTSRSSPSAGTGIGAGLILGGQVVRGAGNAAGELGFLPFDGDVFNRPPLATGLLEQAVATDGIRARYAELSGQSVAVPEIFDFANRGDRTANQVLDETAQHLGRAIVALSAIVDPGRVILGGLDRGANRACRARSHSPRGRLSRSGGNRGKRPRATGGARGRDRDRTWPPAQHAVRPGGPPGNRNDPAAGADHRAEVVRPMTDRASLLARLTDALDREAAITLLATAVGHESVTGNEAGFAELSRSRAAQAEGIRRRNGGLSARPPERVG